MTLSVWPSAQGYAAQENPPTAYPTFADLYAESFDASVAHLQSRFQLARDDAEEIVQTAFLKQWERNPGLVGIDNPFKYVRTFIVYDALNYLHTHRQHPLLSARSLDHPVVDGGSFTLGDVWSLQQQGMSVEETVIVREQLRQAADYLHRLPDVQQVLLQMNAAGYSYTEIQEYLSVHYGFHGSLRVIEHRLANSRHQMRQQVRAQRLQQHVIHRKRIRKLAGWAAQYTACIICGTTEIAHRAHGKCRHCYDNERKAQIRRAAKVR